MAKIIKSPGVSSVAWLLVKLWNYEMTKGNPIGSDLLSERMKITVGFFIGFGDMEIKILGSQGGIMAI